MKFEGTTTYIATEDLKVAVNASITMLINAMVTMPDSMIAGIAAANMYNPYLSVCIDFVTSNAIILWMMRCLIS